MYTWVGYLHMSANEKNIPEAQVIALMNAVSYAMNFYAPFEKDK